jgi:hypothetical protein
MVQQSPVSSPEPPLRELAFLPKMGFILVFRAIFGPSK